MWLRITLGTNTSSSNGLLPFPSISTNLNTTQPKPEPLDIIGLSGATPILTKAYITRDFPKPTRNSNPTIRMISLHELPLQELRVALADIKTEQFAEVG
jgi:hypothetical protein